MSSKLRITMYRSYHKEYAYYKWKQQKIFSQKLKFLKKKPTPTPMWMLPLWHYLPGHICPGLLKLNIVAAFLGMHVSPAKHSYVWLPRKCDYRTDTHTQRDRQTDAVMLKSVSPKVLTDRISLGLTECRIHFYSFYCSDWRTFLSSLKMTDKSQNFSTSLQTPDKVIPMCCYASQVTQKWYWEGFFCNGPHVYLWEVLCASQDFQITCCILFPDENKKKNVLQSLNNSLIHTWCLWFWCLLAGDIKEPFTDSKLLGKEVRICALPVFSPHLATVVELGTVIGVRKHLSLVNWAVVRYIH